MDMTQAQKIISAMPVDSYPRLPKWAKVVCRTSDGSRHVRHDLSDGSAIVIRDECEWGIGVHSDHLDTEEAAILAEETGVEEVYVWPVRHGRARLAWPAS